MGWRAIHRSHRTMAERAGLGSRERFQGRPSGTEPLGRVGSGERANPQQRKLQRLGHCCPGRPVGGNDGKNTITTGNIGSYISAGKKINSSISSREEWTNDIQRATTVRAVDSGARRN